MKNIYLLFCFFTLTVNAQIHKGTIEINSQQELDSVFKSKYTVIEGDLIINSDKITELKLNHIQRVLGKLSVSLKNLKIIQFKNLEKVKDRLALDYIPIQAINFPKLKYLSELYIRRGKLEVVNFENLEKAVMIVLKDFPLKKMNFSKLSEVVVLEIRRTDLNKLNQFKNLTFASEIILGENELLKSVDFQNLKDLRILKMDHNSKLERLSLGKVKTIKELLFSNHPKFINTSQFGRYFPNGNNFIQWKK